MNKFYSILGIPIEFDYVNINRLLHQNIQNSSKGYICTINANIVAEAYVNIKYHAILNNSLINICDGSILSKFLSWIYKSNLQSFPGPDFFIEVIKNKKYVNYFLGSNDETLVRLKKNLLDYNPDIESKYFKSLPYLPVENFDYLEISKHINIIQPDIIWVSLGAPKQEIFTSKLLPYINKGIIINIGAAFDFYGGNEGFKRAPLLIRKTRLEWAWRIYLTPKKTIRRLQREFIILPRILLLERIRLYKLKNENIIN